MMDYVDTNVILASYMPKDKVNGKAAAFFQEHAARRVISPVSVVELAAVVSKLDQELQAPEELLKEPTRRRIRALVEFMIGDCNASVVSLPTQARVKIGGVVLSIPIEYRNCMRLAHVLRLKALDLLHVAYADGLRAWGYDLDTFVTFDHDILQKADVIREELNIKIQEP